MSTEKYLEKLSQFWLKPILIGFLVSLGYNCTKNITSTQENITNTVKQSKSINNIEGKYTKEQKIFNSSKGSFRKQITPIKKQVLSRKAFVGTDLNEIPKEVKKEKINLIIQEKEIKNEAQNKVKKFDSLEAKKYFQKYNLQELFNTLPSE